MSEDGPHAVTTTVTAPGSEPDLSGFDIFDPDQAGRKWELLAGARRDQPVFRTEAMGGMWVVTRHDDVRYVLENPLLFSSASPSILPNPICMAPIDTDPPLHRDFRTVINPYLSRSYLTRFEDSMRGIVTEALDGFVERGSCEFDREFGVPVTSRILAQVVFDETDTDRLRRAVDAATRMGLYNTPDTFVDMAQACEEFLGERERSGHDRDDLLGALLRAEVGGRPLTPRERLGVVTVLFIGGLDTTRAALANILVNLTRDPDLERRVRDPRWVRTDMDEFLRFESPVTCLVRTATEEVAVGGVTMRPGDRVLAHFASANRDEAKYPDADRLRFDATRAGNAAFGLGIHRCAGAHLARLEIALAFEELLARATNFRLLQPITIAPGIVHHPRELHIAFDRLSA
jgi:cytochrome P450